MSLTHHRRANLSVQAMLQVLAEHGLDPNLCLEGTGLDPAEILSSETVISDEDEIGILERALEQLPTKAGYGLRAAGTFQAITYGVWGLAIISSSRIRDAFEIGTRYSAPFVLSKLSVEDDGTKHAVIVDMHDLPVSIQRYVFERVYATYMMFVRDMLPGQDPSIFELHLPISDADYLQRLGEMTGKTIVPRQARFAIVTQTDWMDQPLPQAEPVVHVHFTQQLRALLKSRQELPDHAQLIRDHMVEENRFSPTLDEVAAKVGMSARSFRRRLQGESTSFKETVLSTKMLIAKEFLTTAGLSVGSTADRLGYSETASFSRAYTRWWGHNPGQSGKQNLQPEMQD